MDRLRKIIFVASIAIFFVLHYLHASRTDYILAIGLGLVVVSLLEIFDRLRMANIQREKIIEALMQIKT